jgi:hypothetical protein
MPEPRGEIGDLDGVAFRIGKPCHQDRGIPDIELFRGSMIGQFYRAIAEAVAVVVFAQQGTEKGVSVEIRQAPPDDLSARVDQRAYLAVAHKPQIKGTLHIGLLSGISLYYKKSGPDTASAGGSPVAAGTVRQDKSGYPSEFLWISV